MSVTLFIIGLMATWSLFIFLMVQSVCIPLECFLVTTHKQSLGQGYTFSSVCQEFCTQQGVCLSACWDTAPPGTRPPLEQALPWTRHPLGPDPPEQAPPQIRHSRHPLEQAPPRAGTPCRVHAGRYSQRGGGMHPTGMQSC